MIHRLVRHRHDPRSESIWLTIYADMITNLMLVFLALYGLTVMGKDALDRAVDSMKHFEPNPAASASRFERLAPALKETVGNLPDVAVIADADAVRVQFGEKVLFPSGSATLKPSAYEPLLTLSALLKFIPNTIVIEGHTDPVPLGANAVFKNNYELSLARSMAVVRLLIDKGGLPAPQLASAAYGEYRPRASNETAEGRRLNRRVEIAIFRDFPYADKPAAAPAAAGAAS
jgi:chemotaxis protein MotB